MNERERIEFLMNSYGLSPSQLADKAGIPRASVSHILGGRNKPSLDVLQKIALVFPDVNLRWLMLGVGNPSVAVASSGESAGEDGVTADTAVVKETVPEATLFGEYPATAQPLRVEGHTQPYGIAAQGKQDARRREPSSETVRPATPRQTPARKSQQASSRQDTTRRIKEIRVFYNDGTFEILFPEK